MHTPNSGDLNPESQDPGKRPPVDTDPDRHPNEDRPGQPKPGKGRNDYKPGDDQPNDLERTPPDMGSDDVAR